MKITLTIDTTESFSSQGNLRHLIDMALEECEYKTGHGSTEYTDGQTRRQTCNYSLEKSE